VDTPDNIPTQPTDTTGTPEDLSADALEATPNTTEDAEIVPLLMPEDTSNIVPGEYIVVYKKNKGDSKTLKAGRDKVRKKGGQIKASYSAALKGFSARLTAEALHELRQDPDIAYIEPDQYIYAVDGDIAEQSTPQILPSGVSGYWGLDRIDQATANRDYRFYYPSSAGTGVHVYVLDSGILTSHEQFEGRASNDYDLINDGRSESEYYFHGTAVASIVGGKDYGVAKNVHLHSVRVLDYQGQGTFSKVVKGLDWVIAHHTSPAVVNMSLGGSSVSSSLNNAVASTVNAGITVVVSSGNRLGTTDSWDACNWSPASAPLAITVGATTSSDSRDTSYSTYGTCLDLFAPGTSILSATNTGDTAYVYRTGTSMAAPMVAGAAALYLADHASATPAEVTSVILGVATSGVLSNIGSGSPNLLLFVYGQVVLVSPANGALINQSAPTLSWRTGYSGDVYTLEVDDSSAFNSLYYTTETENTSAVVAGLTEGIWYWRVRAYNPASGTTEWSETFSFSVDLTPPEAPTLSSPADNTYSVGTPAFAWGAVDTAAYYQFQYGPSGSDPETYVHRSAELTNRSYTPPTMTREVQYYWFARARDAAGNWSAWSSPFRIMSVPAGPAAPALSSPSNGAYLNDKTPEFTWVANTNPEVTYQIQISTNSGFSSILQETDNLTTAAYVSAHLDDGKYYWRVRGKSKYGIYGGWSSIRYFRIDTERPEAPDLVSPVSGARTVGEPIFAWSAVSGATAYQLALSLSDNLKGSESNEYIYISAVISGTSYTPSIKNKNATYYWNVRARDAAGNWSLWSKSNFLTIVADTPAQASLVDPVSGKLTRDNTPTLSWNLLANSEYYHLQVAANSTFSAPLLLDEDGLTGTSYTVDAADDLDDGTYYWRVRGRNNSSDYGAWSSARYFKVDTSAPDAPQAVYPLDAAAVIGTPTFKWSRPASAKYYQLRYADADAPGTILYTRARSPAIT
jgi:Subtilisin-like serine proteases